VLKDRYDLPSQQRHIENLRLQKIVMQWLSIERQRESFRIAELEKSHQIQVGNLMIRTRIDRVDELDDGTSAIIDYKTGRPDPAQWMEDRVTDPQLPLYSLNLSNHDIGALMFAQVRSKEGECGFRGLARSIDSWPGARTRKLDDLFETKGWSSSADVLRHWEEVLPALGDEFSSGVATVDPVDYDLACKYCDLTALCRIMEQEKNLAGDQDD
jgi:ATP-dependent helicase/DNAse subunit B